MATLAAERTASDRRVHRADLVLAVVVTGVQLAITVLAGHHQPERRPIDAGAVALLAAAGLALAGRRRFPLAVLVVTYAATLTYWVSDYPRGPVFFSLVIAFVSAVFYGRRLGAWIMLGVGWVTFLWLGPLIGRGAAPTLGAVTALAAWHLALGTGTEVVRSRRERFAEVARSRAEARRRQASEERLRMAQELHDVLAHNISLISVQAGVGLHLLDEQPEQARRSLTAIKDASRDALDELRAVLDVLRRDGDDAAPRVPAPRLSTDLPGLVSKTSASGVEVELRVAGAPHALPPGVDRAAFRIAQEALTNVARHAGRTTAHVEVRYLDEGLVVQVDDDGSSGTTEAPRGSGAGITGMRERATALGGHLDAGPRPGGGFRVRAWLPAGAGAGTAVRPS